MPTNFWKLINTAVIVLTVFIAIVAVKELKSIAYVGTNSNQTNTITVEGTGYTVAVPDIASFSLLVLETDKTVALAQNRAAEKINSIMKTLRDAGVADKDMQTASYNISPHYEYQSFACSVNSCPPSKSVLTGYDVSESIVVKIRDLSKAGAIFSSVGSLNVNNIGGLTFSVDDPDSVKAIARGKAISNAEAKAAELAKQLKIRLVRVTSFYESGPISPTYSTGAANKAFVSAREDAVSPEIPTGENKITSNITITYEIE